MLQTTENGLNSLVQVLTQDGQGLQALAQNYQETDGAIASGIQSGSKAA